MSFWRRTLRLPRHRATTAHLCSAYPLLAEGGPTSCGPYLGTNLLSGGGGFAYDPFEAYRAGLVTNPNMLFAGEPGTGKSATAKCLIHRCCGVFGRWVAIADPKGEYRPLADALGLAVLNLRPGGSTRLNPLDGGADVEGGVDELARRQSALVVALVGTVLRRDLTPAEDAAVGGATLTLARAAAERTGSSPPTLADLLALLADPTDTVQTVTRTSVTELRLATEAPVHALGKLLDRSLRGMFDGQTNVDLDWRGTGILLDLSAVHHDSEALALVMLAATAWLQAVLARPTGPPRLQVLDEAWSLLASERTSRYLQSCWKLGRAYGVANLAIVHRLSDLRSQADDGSATTKVAMGLLADTQTRVLFRQSSDQVADARALLDLTSTEAQILARLCRGRSIWKIGGRSAIVQTAIADGERVFCDTDARMAVAA